MMAPAGHDLAPHQCLRCGYALVGIADDQPCPECGLLAARSRRPHDELFLGRPTALRRLAIGIWLILVGSVWPIAWTLLWSQLALMIERMSEVRQTAESNFGSTHMLGFGSSITPLHLVDAGWANLLLLLLRHPQAGWLVGTLLLIFGAGCLAGGEAYEPIDRVDRWRRWTLLAVSFLPTIALLNWLATDSSPVFMEPALEMPTTSAVLLATLGSASFVGLLFFQLRRLAHRAGRQRWVIACAVVGGGAAGGLALAAAGYLIGLHAKQSAGGGVWLAMTLPLTMAAILFFTIGGWVMVRLALALGRACRQVQHEWRRDDRAAIIL